MFTEMKRFPLTTKSGFRQEKKGGSYWIGDEQGLVLGPFQRAALIPVHLSDYLSMEFSKNRFLGRKRVYDCLVKGSVLLPLPKGPGLFRETRWIGRLKSES